MSEPTLSLREWRDGDEVTVADALGPAGSPQVALSRALLGPATQQPWRRTVVAEADGAIVGAAAVSESSLHPDRLWLYTEVLPAHRRRGVGTALVGALREEVPPSGTSGLRTRYPVNPELSENFEESETSAAAPFAASIGLIPIQRSRLVVVAPESLAVPPFGPTGPTLEDLATGSVELTKAVAAFYDAVHAPWDRSEMTLGRAQDHLLAPATGARGAVVLRDRPKEAGGRILSFAVSYDPAVTDPTEAQDAPTEVLLGYDTDLDPARARGAVHNLLAMLVARYPVQLEIDDAMEPLAAVVTGLLNAGSAHIEAETEIAATPA
ncbi:GNAT family N-acetyltransferase [Occultella gossypii]|uniref:GNAT family N-acetyltransferase n=1 Tax=Occultella gossypii TaxID=2800820 RepID=A0ABS7S5F4_9MICO|nr:GNAT family N-acetyltransferase [Occultella gossypii]MBZ2194546.1 GNAT family N-acetyltransferase [Occultella gossypii]